MKTKHDLTDTLFKVKANVLAKLQLWKNLRDSKTVSAELKDHAEWVVQDLEDILKRFDN